VKKGNLRDWTLLFVKRSGYQWIWATAEIQNDGMSCLLGQKGCVIADELKCLTTSVIGQWVTGGAGSVVKPAAPLQTVFSAFPAYDALIKLKIKETEAWLAVLPRFDKKKMFKCDFDEESKTKEGKE